MFTKAIVRTPGRSLVDGLTTVNLGKPDYLKALEQHEAYIAALHACGVEVDVLPPLEAFPDSCFIEDVALITPTCAIITRPGAPSRRGEVEGMGDVLEPYFHHIEYIKTPGTVEGGDILMVGRHFYVGLSARTNQNGANQLIDAITLYGLSGSTLPLKEMLHLKTGVAYLENNTLAAYGEILSLEAFSSFRILEIPEKESYAANCIWVNGTVLVPAGFPQTAKMIQKAGYPVLEVDVSEFQKLDGGLSCLSLRF